MSALDQLAEAITAALDEEPAGDVLAVLTGAFVSLTLELVRRQGHEADKSVTIDGGKNRDITIHAPKPTASPAEPAAAMGGA